jgi:hypothetical protein
MKTSKKLKPLMRGGVKYDNEKLRMDLLPPKSIEEIASIFTYGARKYNSRNWELGMLYGRVYAAIQRHLLKYWSGEDDDPESGLPHLAHAGFGILALLEYRRIAPQFDDRPIKQGIKKRKS